jgi:hypothetical protein
MKNLSGVSLLRVLPASPRPASNLVTFGRLAAVRNDLRLLDEARCAG